MNGSRSEPVTDTIPATYITINDMNVCSHFQEINIDSPLWHKDTNSQLYTVSKNRSN